MLPGPGYNFYHINYRQFYIFLRRVTLYNLIRVWPMINSDSALYSICGASTNKGDLLNIVAQPNMTDDDKNKVSAI